MDFKTHDDLEIRYYTDEWAPYYFDFEDSMPSGTTISSATVKAYQGKVTATADLAAETEITTTIIDQDTAPSVVSGTQVSVVFEYDATRKGDKATLIFELTLSNGGKHPFYFYPVVVK